MAIASTSVFVGRQHELRALHDAHGKASAGHSQILVVEGEAGIGKTTLVRRFLSELPETRILRASGDESESHVPFAMADQLLRSDGRGSGALRSGRHAPGTRRVSRSRAVLQPDGWLPSTSTQASQVVLSRLYG